MSFLLIAGLFFPTLSALWEEWATVTGHYSHGLVLLMLGFWLVWRSRGALSIRRNGGQWAGLTVFCLGYLIWLAVHLANILRAEYVAMALATAGLWWALFPPSAWMGALWQFGIVGLVLPVWHVLNPPLQSISTIMVGKLLSLVSVPLFIDGNVVTLPNGVFEVAGGCSGLGFLLTSLSLAYFLLATSRTTLIQKLGVLSTTVAIALITNWVRISIIIYIGYQSDMQSPIVEDHLWVGWVAFAAMAVPVLLLLSGRLPPVEPARTSEQPAGQNGIRLVTGVSVVAVILVLFRTVVATTEPPELQLDRAQLENSLLDQGLYACSTTKPERWNPRFVGADEVYRQAFCSDQRAPVWLEIVAYHLERQGKELIYFDNDPIGFPDHLISEMPSAEAGTETPLYLIAGRNRSLVLDHWYLVDGERYDSDRRAKLAQVAAKLLGDSSAASISVLSECREPDCSAAVTRIRDTSEALRITFRRELHDGPANEDLSGQPGMRE